MQKSHGSNTEAGKADLPNTRHDQPFISRKLDEAKLKPPQFRIFCHVIRRGDCFESVENMAEACRLSIKTVKAVLLFLVSHFFISKQKRPGHTCIYRQLPASLWQPVTRPAVASGQTTPQAVNYPTSQPKGHPDHPTQTAPHKGNPIKDIPIRDERPSLENRDGSLMIKDRERLEKHLQAASEDAKPDADLIAGLRAELRPIEDELRRRGKIAKLKKAAAASSGLGLPVAKTNPTTAQAPRLAVKKVCIWDLSEEARAKFKKPLEDFKQKAKPNKP